MSHKSGVPSYYFFTDEDTDNLIIEWFENDLGEISLPQKVQNKERGGTFLITYLDIIFFLIDDFVKK